MVFAEPAKLHDQQLLVALTVALAFCFVGGAHLLGINGLLLVVIGGVVYARVVEGDKRGTESQLQETVDLIFSTLVFAIFGLTIPFDRWYLIGWWRGLILCIGLALFRRVPWMVALMPVFKEQIHSVPDALFVGWFGPIGVGAIFYALFASEDLGEDRIWVVVSMIVFSQVIIFGVTDTFFTRWYATTNPNYIRRRRRKQKAIERAETQINIIQDNLVQTLESMPASPYVAGESPAWENEIPDLDLAVEYPGSPNSIELGIRSRVGGTTSGSVSRSGSRSDLRGEHVTFNLDSEFESDETDVPRRLGIIREEDDGVEGGSDEGGSRTILSMSRSLVRDTSSLRGVSNDSSVGKSKSFHDHLMFGGGPRSEDIGRPDFRSSTSSFRRSSLPAGDRRQLAKSSDI